MKIHDKFYLNNLYLHVKIVMVRIIAVKDQFLDSVRACVKKYVLKIIKNNKLIKDVMKT